MCERDVLWKPELVSEVLCHSAPHNYKANCRHQHMNVDLLKLCAAASQAAYC